MVYKQRKRKTTTSLKDRSFRKGRSYKEFLEYIAANKSVYVVEMDTVEGAKRYQSLLSDYVLSKL